MHAQPRGKKRGAQENVDAGGKKKAKKEEELKPFVCAIYRRDIASFLPRAKIQQWRLTSSFSNACLSEFPSELPRFKYHSLRVIFASADRCRVKKDGFLHYQSDDNSMEGKDFNSIFDFRFCCRDVKDHASELVGQRLFPNKPDHEGVAFKHCRSRPDRWSGPKGVVCRVPNLLSKKTAPAMLHFLRHLSQACYEHIEINPGATADAAECALNPLVVQVLPKFGLRGVKFGQASNWDWIFWVESGHAELSNLTVKMASEMHIRYNLLYYYYYSHGYFGADLPWLLDFIANGRQLDKRIELGGDLYSVELDQIIKYFEEDLPSLDGTIRDVRHKGTVWYDDWPVRCSREAARQVTERDDGTVDYLFDYTNAHTKEPFSLLLGTRRNEGGMRICKFHLTFGSA